MEVGRGLTEIRGWYRGLCWCYWEERCDSKEKSFLDQIGDYKYNWRLLISEVSREKSWKKSWRGLFSNHNRFPPLLLSFPFDCPVDLSHSLIFKPFSRVESKDMPAEMPLEREVLGE